MSKKRKKKVTKSKILGHIIRLGTFVTARTFFTLDLRRAKISASAPVLLGHC